MSPTQDVNGRTYFNHWSETYERSITQWLFFDRVHRGVLRRLPAGFYPASILDIGCGTGRLLRRMQARWPAAALTGVDLADGMLAQALQRTPDAMFCRAPAEHLPLENVSIDLVTSTASFHHWSDQIQGISEAARVLRPGGMFALGDMSISMHGHPLRRRQVRAMFEAAGFTIRSQTNPVPFFTFTVGEKRKSE